MKAKLALAGIPLALVIMAAGGCSRSDSPTRAGADGGAKAVRTAVVELTNRRDTISYSAIVAPNAQVDVAFRVSGYVESLDQTRAADGRVRPLEPGAAVKAGTRLARVRPTDYQAVADKARGARDEADAGIRAAEAQAVEAQSGLVQAQLGFERIAALWRQESVPKPAYDGSKTRLDVAAAKVDAANAGIVAARQRAVSAAGQFQEAQIALDDTDLRSPLDGTLLERRVEVGSFATAGTPAFVIADLHLMKARFNVPDTALHAFHAGQSLPLIVDAFPGERFDGRILSIAPAADPRARSFEIVVSIANAEMKLRSGMIASVRAPDDGSRPEVQIPIDALVHDPVKDRYFAYTTELRDGKALVRGLPITPGPLAGNQVVILDGLTPGQRIIVSGANLLRPGDVVRDAP